MFERLAMFLISLLDRVLESDTQAISSLPLRKI